MYTKIQGYSSLLGVTGLPALCMHGFCIHGFNEHLAQNFSWLNPQMQNPWILRAHCHFF